MLGEVLVRITWTLEMVSIVLFLNYAYHEKLRLGAWDFAMLGVTVAYLEVVNELYTTYNLTMGNYLIIFLFLQLRYRNSFKKNVINLFLFIVLISLLQLVLSMISFWVEKYLGEEGFGLLVSSLVFIVILAMGKIGIVNRLSVFLYRSENVVRIVFGVLLFALIYSMILYKNDHFFRRTDYLLIVVWSVLICFITVKWQRARLDSMVKSKELEVKEIYEKQYQDLLHSVRKRQHDFDNQMNALYGQQVFANSLDDLIMRQREYSDVIHQENRYNKLIVKGAKAPILTGFLFRKLMEAEEKGCIVCYEVSYDTMDSVLPMYQLIDVFGVLIDNAIEALEQYEGKKTLLINIKEYQDQIECGVYNPCEYVSRERIHEMVKSGVSTKGIGRGIGLSKVVEILNEKGIDLLIWNKRLDSSGENNYLAVEFQIKK